jgi:hypothetical protein
VGWLDGKGVELHPWGPKIKLHKWHELWSTLEYWLNIPYLLRLPRLGGDTCQQLIWWKIMKLKIIQIKIHPIISYYIEISMIINIINFKNNVSQVFRSNL